MAAFEADHDDYRAIMVKALAGRFPEACAEHMHEVVRDDPGCRGQWTLFRAP